MAKLTAREAAVLRMSMEDEFRNLKKDAQNASDDIGAEYPKMLYRKTDAEERRVVSTDKDGKPREIEVINRFAGYLCDTTIATSADHAEALSAEGWDISPAAAHGVVLGLVAATSAKDDEIAALKEQLAAATLAVETRRGPGRPPKEQGLRSE